MTEKEEKKKKKKRENRSLLFVMSVSLMPIPSHQPSVLLNGKLQQKQGLSDMNELFLLFLAHVLKRRLKGSLSTVARFTVKTFQSGFHAGELSVQFLDLSPFLSEFRHLLLTFGQCSETGGGGAYRSLFPDGTEMVKERERERERERKRERDGDAALCVAEQPVLPCPYFYI